MAVFVPGPQVAQATVDCGGVEGPGRVGPGDGGAVLRGRSPAAGSAGPGLGLEELIWSQNASCGVLHC